MFVGKHRGKVVLIDIWATWCAPCRQANLEMKPLKEEWKDKDIVFVYVAGENSPEKLWKEMSAEISGEHHRLTDAQFNYMMHSLMHRVFPLILWWIELEVFRKS